VVLVIAGVDALRSALSESPAPPASTQSLASPTTAPNDSLAPTTMSTENFAPAEGVATYTTREHSPRVRKYIAQAVAICVGANAGFQSEGEFAFEEAAAAASQWALANLRALSPPRADRALVNQFLSAMEKEIDAIPQFDSQKRIRATHQKDALADRLSARLRLRPREVLRACPVSLPA
jgi:metal-dependent amidase/aminoacylase/carboxypeptidase family protein